MLRHIDTIIHLADVKRGDANLILGQMNLPETIDRVLEVYRPIAKAQSISLSVNMEGMIPLIQCDATGFAQALANIMDNAIRFSDYGSMVVIYAQLVDDNLTVSIVDKGIGMAVDEVAICMEVFRQVDASYSRKFNGLGLGLTLTKIFVEQHQGEIQIESSPGVGTRVTLVIPVSGPDSQQTLNMPFGLISNPESMLGELGI